MAVRGTTRWLSLVVYCLVDFGSCLVGLHTLVRVELHTLVLPA